MDSHSSVAFAPGNVRSTCDAAQSIADGRCFSTARPYATYIESIIFAPPFVMAPPAPNAIPTEKRLAELNSLRAPPLEAASAATAPDDSRAMFTVKNAVVAATKTMPPVIRPTATTKWSGAMRLADRQVAPNVRRRRLGAQRSRAARGRRREGASQRVTDRAKAGHRSTLKHGETFGVNVRRREKRPRPGERVPVRRHQEPDRRRAGDERHERQRHNRPRQRPVPRHDVPRLERATGAEEPPKVKV